MSIENERLVSLIEYVQQSARLRSTPKSAISQHKLFSIYEHELQGLPGIHLNTNTADSEDEIWLSVERMHEAKPPEITSAILQPWVKDGQSPKEEPKLFESILGSSLIAAGTHRSSHSDVSENTPTIAPDATVTLHDYNRAAQVRNELENYVRIKWQPWAEKERLRRSTIRLYSDLFTLKHQLEDGIVESQLELVWGVGIGIWNHDDADVRYPLITRSVELALNAETAEIEIRPCDVDARLEVDWYASVGNPGVADLEKSAKEFFSSATQTFSPFDRGTFEAPLRTAAACLDKGYYWPNEVPAEDRKLPKADIKLKVTDTWVLFARPRTNSLFLQDMEKLKQAAESVEEPQNYPPAVAAIVTDPKTSNPVVELPLFRGVSASYHSGNGSVQNARDLYFPKPFNDEQVRIIQLLDVSDGVVVQGPPGTGKTHTIANVICHYLAEGKRVLVTSLKDPALAVLQEQLPDDIRPLAISLLTSEQKGMKQFEYAIQKIASEVQGLDRSGTTRAIAVLEKSIDALHSKLASIDYKIGDWAKQNLAIICLDSEEIAPQDAAREVVDNVDQFGWIPDDIGIDPKFAPQFSDADVIALREARRVLGQDIDYIGVSLPQLVEFPDSKALLEVHQDLSQFEMLSKAVEDGNVPALADSSQETITLAQQLLNRIDALYEMRIEILQEDRPWAASMRQCLRRGTSDDLFKMLESLGTDLRQAQELRKTFIERPVSVSDDTDKDSVFMEAVANLAEGKSAFGIKGLFGKSEQKKWLESIRILTDKPNSSDDWIHVYAYLNLQKRLRELALRWNTLSYNLDIDPVEYSPAGGLTAAQDYAIYLSVKVAVKTENEICIKAARVFPNWAYAREVADNEQRLVDLKRALQHHLTKNRLANVWAVKERFQKVLEGRHGRIIWNIRDFLAQKLGNPAIDDAQMQAEWSALMAELARVLGLGTHFAAVRRVCEQIESSGAPKHAEALEKPLDGTVDYLLPDNWRNSWRLRRLTTYLQLIDAREELKNLSKDRREVADDLSRAYSDIVVKRTWLKLAENASPSIRSALQAYLNAIQKIGKGTGKRAARYRHNAREAAALANPAVPCWIMPHYRVSETLPAELGCFDLVVIDEASQSDLSALPALLRAQKVLIVGDDKQVSPEGVGIEEEKVLGLMKRFLGNQVPTYRAQMSPVQSIYGLFKVVFAHSMVMLKEHFRCVGPIIEYSKREFYNHELQPLRVPKATERLDPPLVDILVTDGFRDGDVNKPEADVIVNEIKAIVTDPKMAGRTIGVVSLLADKQPLLVWQRLTEELGPEIIERHNIACGDSRTFQGKQRDIMFLSMVSAPNDVGASLSRDTFAQRFNVACSRARDRMYLIRSVDLEHLSEADRLRRNLIAHFAAPFAQDEMRVEDARTLCESPFEREMFDELTSRGYWVTPQVRTGHYRIDMVVEGNNDARLAIECDGDQYHGADKWADDLQRQRILERAGWVFWRCFATAFIRRRKEVLDDLLKTLAERGIEPIGAECAPRSVHTERRVVHSTDFSEKTEIHFLEQTDKHITDQPPSDGRIEDSRQSLPRDSITSADAVNSDEAVEYDDQDSALPVYTEWVPSSVPDPRNAARCTIVNALADIVTSEGPATWRRIFELYRIGLGLGRLKGPTRQALEAAAWDADKNGSLSVWREIDSGEWYDYVVHIPDSERVAVRQRGPRNLQDVPCSEIAELMRRRQLVDANEDWAFRQILSSYGLRRLTEGAKEHLRRAARLAKEQTAAV